MVGASNPQGAPISFPPGQGSLASSGFWPDFSVNAAAVDAGPDQSAVLRAGSAANPVGAFNGGGTGNKAILGLDTLDGQPLASLLSIAFEWESFDGPTGPFYNPPGVASVLTPYVNVIVDFDPVDSGGSGDLRILSLMDDGLAPAITAAIGSYANPGGANILTYSWQASQDVLIVLAPPNPVPGGVPPNVSVGASWPENAYSFAALVSANPNARIVAAFTGDGGLPAGAVTPGILLVSGDSSAATRSSKLIRRFEINGQNRLS